VISHVIIDKNDPTVGYVRVQYTCQPGPDAPHLWVSVKQTADRTADPGLLEEGSGFGGVAAAWSQSHPSDINCDGKNHVQVFAVYQDEELYPGGPTVGYGSLARGDGYVQFCLFTGEAEPTFVFDMAFRSVK
jgi:hypothetical protein